MEALPASTASTASKGSARCSSTAMMAPILKPLLRTKMMAFLPSNQSVSQSLIMSIFNQGQGLAVYMQAQQSPYYFW